MSVEIEQAIARGWDEEQIARRLSVTLRKVRDVRLALDALVNADLFALAGVSRCRRNHPLIGDNVYRRASGARECRTCKAERDRVRKDRRRGSVAA